MSYLDGLIRETIRAEGPISVARYMQIALQQKRLLDVAAISGSPKEYGLQ